MSIEWETRAPESVGCRNDFRLSCYKMKIATKVSCRHTKCDALAKEVLNGSKFWCVGWLETSI